MSFYRFHSNKLGIYEAVEKDCLRDDRRRIGKADGAWLPRVGASYPGAISFWTEYGLKKYLESGLQDWHRRVTQCPLEIHVVEEIRDFLYSDEYQVICKPESISSKQVMTWPGLAKKLAVSSIKNKVVAYITRITHGQKEILVFDHEKQWSEAGTQVPAGTVDPEESLHEALLREIAEETGISELQILAKIDEYIFYRTPHQEFNHRHIFELTSQEPLPDRWEHQVTGHGIDDGMKFYFYWMPLSEAKMKISGGMGDSLCKLVEEI